MYIIMRIYIVFCNRILSFCVVIQKIWVFLTHVFVSSCSVSLSQSLVYSSSNMYSPIPVKCKIVHYILFKYLIILIFPTPFKTLFSFSRKAALKTIWFSFSLFASLDLRVACLFFSLFSQYFSSLSNQKNIVCQWRHCPALQPWSNGHSVVEWHQFLP